MPDTKGSSKHLRRRIGPARQTHRSLGREGVESKKLTREITRALAVPPQGWHLGAILGPWAVSKSSVSLPQESSSPKAFVERPPRARRGWERSEGSVKSSARGCHIAMRDALNQTLWYYEVTTTKVLLNHAGRVELPRGYISSCSRAMVDGLF